MQHFVFAHDIKDMNHLVKEIEKAQRKEAEKVEFRKHVEDLKSKMRKGIISAKDYRELIIKWHEEHKEAQ